MRNVDLGSPLRTPLNHPINQWRDLRTVLRGIPTLEEQSEQNAERYEGQSGEVKRTVDLGTLQDLP